MQIEEVFEEYMDALVTVELAVEFAVRDRRGPNTVIRQCWRNVKPRMINRTVIGIFDGVCKQPFPDGALKMLRRQLEMIADEK